VVLVASRTRRYFCTIRNVPKDRSSRITCTWVPGYPGPTVVLPGQDFFLKDERSNQVQCTSGVFRGAIAIARSSIG
jgi:hypothetical protein